MVVVRIVFAGGAERVFHGGEFGPYVVKKVVDGHEDAVGGF